MAVYPVSGKKIVVFGLARSGLAAVAWLLEHGAHPIAVDSDIGKQKQALALGAQVSSFDQLFWMDVAAVIQSPGIPISHPLSQHALHQGIPVLSDCELFRQANPEAFIVGVTGTNGKSTTTVLIGHILKQASYPVAIGGNIGIPVLSLPSLGEKGIYVLELSSYQLELSNSLNVNIVAWLNISEDHLERHGSMDQYVQAKYKIFQHVKQAPKAVIGIDDVYSHEIYGKHRAVSSHITIPVSCKTQLEEGLWVHDHHLYDCDHGQQQMISDLAQYTQLQGLHNYQNVAVAYGVCMQLGLTSTQILEGISTFPGLEHRQEWIAEIDGVVFINDSKATNAEATSKALSVYTSVYWIAGGVPKSDGIDSLKPYFPQIREAFLFGQAETEFATTLDGAVPYSLCQTLDVAVKRAYEAVKKSVGGKGVILFSPACASFDQFQDFEHRGRTFKHLVYQLKGLPC
jgi:UDP-N-acetylmuramoylalanine--D-glutamate ligase